MESDRIVMKKTWQPPAPPTQVTTTSTPIQAAGYVEEWDGQFKVSRLDHLFVKPGFPETETARFDVV